MPPRRSSNVAAVEHGRGLERGAAGDQLVVGGDEHRAAGEVGDDLAVGRAVGAAADEEHPAVDGRPEARRRPASRLQTTPSTAARASCAGVTSVRSPVSVPVASGRFGVRSPSRWGTSTSAAGARRRLEGELRRSRSVSTPSSRAIASVTLVALSVQTRGRKRPVASAKPATVPVGSAVG